MDVNLAILRAKGHSGSLWLAELLSSLPGFVVFHEFRGACNPAGSKLDRSNSSMARLFTDLRSDACWCAIEHVQHRTSSRRYCTSTCHGGDVVAVPAGPRCGLVGFVTDPTSIVLSDLRALPAAATTNGRRLVIARLVRFNGVKQASSSLRDMCHFTRASDRNHYYRSGSPSAPKDGDAANHNHSTSWMLIPPRLLLRTSAQFVWDRFAPRIAAIAQHEIVCRLPERSSERARTHLMALLIPPSCRRLSPRAPRRARLQARSALCATPTHRRAVRDTDSRCGRRAATSRCRPRDRIATQGCRSAAANEHP